MEFNSNNNWHQNPNYSYDPRQHQPNVSSFTQTNPVLGSTEQSTNTQVYGSYPTQPFATPTSSRPVWHEGDGGQMNDSHLPSFPQLSASFAPIPRAQGGVHGSSGHYYGSVPQYQAFGHLLVPGPIINPSDHMSIPAQGLPPAAVDSLDFNTGVAVPSAPAGTRRRRRARRTPSTTPSDKPHKHNAHNAGRRVGSRTFAGTGGNEAYRRAKCPRHWALVDEIQFWFEEGYESYLRDYDASSPWRNDEDKPFAPNEFKAAYDNASKRVWGRTHWHKTGANARPVQLLAAPIDERTPRNPSRRPNVNGIGPRMSAGGGPAAPSGFARGTMGLSPSNPLPYTAGSFQQVPENQFAGRLPAQAQGGSLSLLPPPPPRENQSGYSFPRGPYQPTPRSHRPQTHRAFHPLHHPRTSIMARDHALSQEPPSSQTLSSRTLSPATSSSHFEDGHMGILAENSTPALSWTGRDLTGPPPEFHNPALPGIYTLPRRSAPTGAHAQSSVYDPHPNIDMFGQPRNQPRQPGHVNTSVQPGSYAQARFTTRPHPSYIPEISYNRLHEEFPEFYRRVVSPSELIEPTASPAPPQNTSWLPHLHQQIPVYPTGSRDVNQFDAATPTPDRPQEMISYNNTHSRLVPRYSHSPTPELNEYENDSSFHDGNDGGYGNLSGEDEYSSGDEENDNAGGSENDDELPAHTFYY